ncbi:MAG: HEPN domain-containing protein [Anaerolineales bacterium]
MTAEANALHEIQLYVAAAHEALAAAKYTLENDFYSTSASRMYYAVFYISTALLKTKGLSFSKHTAVLSAFRQHFIKTGEFPTEFSNLYKLLFDARQAGDYEMLTAFEPNELRERLQKSREFVAEIESWLRKHQFLPKS